MVDLDPEKLRDLPGWENAPIHICMDADCRGLTFCCKPGFSLTFGFKCKRDETLKDLELSPEDFIRIKEDFSKENAWDSDLVCFGSISYCCMRKGGCSRRDPALQMRYPDKTREEFMKIYYEKKKELAKKVLEFVNSNGNKQKVEPYLDLF